MLRCSSSAALHQSPNEKLPPAIRQALSPATCKRKWRWYALSLLLVASLRQLDSVLTSLDPYTAGTVTPHPELGPGAQATEAWGVPPTKPASRLGWLSGQPGLSWPWHCARPAIIRLTRSRRQWVCLGRFTSGRRGNGVSCCSAWYRGMTRANPPLCPGRTRVPFDISHVCLRACGWARLALVADVLEGEEVLAKLPHHIHGAVCLWHWVS